MSGRIAGWAAALWLWTGIAVAAPAAPEVTLDGGVLRGRAQDDGSLLFRAIPFAAAPVGVRRWQAPQPVPAWRGVRRADTAAPTCAQPALGWNDAMARRSSEDCLYLEVQTPALDAAARKPVMVWIHGGANVAGGADGYLPSSLVAQDVVVVTVQYRLGVFGFLSLPELGDDAASPAGNFALLDQIAALRWVQDNIARFGGDPARVTLFGQSAGAQDVGLLMLSPLARGLFAGAIEQSGTAGFGLPARSLAENRALGERIAQRAGASGPRRLARLRAAPVATLLRAAQGLEVPALDDDGDLWLQATVDGQVLPAPPARLLAEGRQARVPLLIGSNAQELVSGGLEGVTARLRRDYPGQADAVLAGYDDTAGRYGDTAMQLSTDLGFRCPALRVAQLQAAAGAPTWHYEFDLAGPGAAVTHSAELPFVFKGLPIGTPALTLQRYWAAFAHAGDPNVAGLPAWPAFAPDRTSLRFTDAGAAPVGHLRQAICEPLDRP